jgi:hypothetical protein
MTKHERATVALAVLLLHEATESNDPAAVRTHGVRLALRVLLPHCPERWPLLGFWDAAQQDNDIGRTQGVTAAFNGIVRQLRASGAYRD